CIEVCKEQKKNMEDTMLELIEVCRQKEFHCMQDNKHEVKNVVEQPTERETRIAKSLQNFRVIHKTSSISLNNMSQISPVHAIAPVLPNEELEYSLSMVYEHLNTTPETESNEIINSGVEELVPILKECEVTSEDQRECDVPVCENSPIFEDLSEIFSDSNNDDISSDDDAFKDIEYVEASPLDPELVSLEEENIEEEEFNLEEIQDGIENFDYDSKGDIHFLEELLVDDSILFPENESLDHHNYLLFPCPPPEPPDVEFFFDSKLDVIVEEISDKLNEDECFNPGE
nr:hypothetical protein [Tanacetum cinerariifolium]